MKPKIDGSIYLNELFPAHDLEFFVVFSSAASVVGNASQSNYISGGVFMAGLAENRRKRGLAASVIQIGMIVGIRHVARTKLADRQLLTSAVQVISKYLYHQMFAAAVIQGRQDSGRQMLKTMGLQETTADAPWAKNPRFPHMMANANNNSYEVITLVPVKEQLELATSIDEVVSVLIESFRIRLVLVLQTVIEKIHPDVQIDDLGIDSLIAVGIRTWFLKELNADVPILKVLGGNSVSELCRETLGKLTWTMPWSSDSKDSVESDNSTSESDGPTTSNTTPMADTDLLDQDKSIKASLDRVGNMSHA